MKKVIVLVLALVIVFSLCISLGEGTEYIELFKGCKGEAVVKLQNRLNELGYSVGTADGDFGGKTEKAIQHFQQDNGLPVTGIMDLRTYNELFSDVSGDGDKESELPASKLFLIEKENKFGYCNEEGEVVIPCTWFSAEDFVGGMALVQEEKDGMYGYIDIEGKLIIPCEWKRAYTATVDGYALVGHGFVNGNGNEYLVYDNMGKVAMPLDNVIWPNVGDGVLVGEKEEGDKKYTFIYDLSTQKTNKIAEGDYSGPIGEGLIDCWKCFMDFKGKKVIDLTNKPYKSCKHGFVNGMCMVIGDPMYQGDINTIGFIDTKGELVIPCSLVTDSTENFSEGLAVTSEGEVGNGGVNHYNYGYIDKTGQIVIDLQYKSAHSFHEGLAAVQNSAGLWGFIDKEGNQVIDFFYNTANDFNNGYCLVGIKDKLFYIDEEGNPAFPFMEGDTLDNLPNKKEAELQAQEDAQQVVLKNYAKTAEDWLTEEWARVSKIEIWETQVYAENDVALVYVTYTHGLNTDWRYALITVNKNGINYTVDRSNSYSADSDEMQSIMSQIKSRFVTVK